MKYGEIDHPSHHHVLELKSVEEPYYCDGCSQLGLLPCYQCPHASCKFHLHQECARPPPTATHPFFKKCIFTFREKSFERICDACGKDILGWSYQCANRKHDLHPCCLKLPHMIKKDGVGLRLADKVSTRCLKCRSKEVTRKMNGWSYASTSSENKYCFHVACVKDLVVENWTQGYFSHGGNLALQSMVPNQEQMELLNNNSDQESSSVRRAKKYWSIIRLAFKLIISAIFGDPISGSVAVVEAFGR